MSVVKSHTYFIGIGSNTRRQHNIKSCLTYIACSFAHCLMSPVYQSPAYGFDGHDFYNAVIKLTSVFKPHEMKSWLQKIEDLHGRDRSKARYSNRTLDMDLLLCDDLIIDDGVVQIPRREITQRDYVLKPLVDIAPEFIHPLHKKKLAVLWQALIQKNDHHLTVVEFN